MLRKVADQAIILGDLGLVVFGKANDGIVLIGGFVGELIISFTCMLDYILAQPMHNDFVFSTKMI